MKKKLTSLFLVAMMAMPLSMIAQTPSPNVTTAPTTARKSWTIPMKGYVVGGGAVTGSFQIQKFALQNNQIVAVGNLILSVTKDGVTHVETRAGQAIPLVAPTTGSAASPTPNATCSILNLVLGPLDLNLLGLQVHLNRVVLDITAQSGAGQLLGNLLCAIANLLNSGGALSQIVDLLNQLLGVLSNLGL